MDKLNWTTKAIQMSNGVVTHTDVEVDHCITENMVCVSYVDEDGTTNVKYSNIGSDGVTPLTNSDGVINSLLYNDQECYVFWDESEPAFT